MSWCETECKKNVPLVNRKCNKLKSLSRGGQGIDQKRKKGWLRGRRERRERIYRDREKRDKRELS